MLKRNRKKVNFLTDFDLEYKCSKESKKLFFDLFANATKELS
jgi:hypothetical protein